MNTQGVQGAVYQMLNHGVSTGGLFLIVGMLSDRRHTRLIAEFGGLKKVMPRLVAAFLIITLSSIGLPGLNGFVGEFLILLGAFRWDPRLAAFAATGVILSATYMLWMFQRVNYGPVTNEKNATLPDLRPREWVVIVPIIAVAILMGVLPNLFLRPIEPSVERMLEPGPSAAQRDPGTRSKPAPGATSARAREPMMPSLERDRPDGVRHRGGASPRWWPRRSAIPASGCRSARSASIGLARRGGRVGAALEPQRDQLRRGRGRQLRPVRHLDSDRRRPAVAGALRRRRSSASGCRSGEYYALMLFAIAGMMLMATATDLLVIFLALEVLSLAVYVLTGIRRDSPASTEAAFKYFLLGAFSSAFFLYGIAFTYGADRQHAARSHRQPDRRAGDGADADAAARGRPAARRLRVQGVGRAVPHVDARRLRRRAAGGHRLHVHRRQGGGVRRVRARVSRRRSSRCAATGAPCSG